MLYSLLEIWGCAIYGSVLYASSCSEIQRMQGTSCEISKIYNNAVITGLRKPTNSRNPWVSTPRNPWGEFNLDGSPIGGLDMKWVPRLPDSLDIKIKATANLRRLERILYIGFWSVYGRQWISDPRLGAGRELTAQLPMGCPCVTRSPVLAIALHLVHTAAMMGTTASL